MKSIIFAKRNLKEIISDPISLVFCLIFPLTVFLLLEIIFTSTGVDVTQAPQFKVENLTSSICVFSFSFLTIFLSSLIAKDRITSFALRLKISPMKPVDFFLGYALPMFPIAFLQAIFTYCIGFCFGLKPSWYLLLNFIMLIPALLLFISFGIIIGSLVSDKAASGISSVIINLTAIMGGMFFSLDNMKGAFKTTCEILPFQPALKVASYTITGELSLIGKSILILLAYVITLFVVSIFVFYKKLNSDKN